MSQRTTEWIEEVDVDYHDRQFKEPYRSTVAFCAWLEKLGYLSPQSELRVLDLCCGQGANLCYMAHRYPRCEFVGIDFNADLVEKANRYLERVNIPRCRFEVGNLYNLDKSNISRFDGVVLFQTLSWLPDYRTPIEAIVQLEADWVALSSLFYNGRVSCTIQIEDYTAGRGGKPRESYYNVYSLQHVGELFASRGYPQLEYVPFEIDVDLPPPASRGMGTYTEKLESGKRIQLSGPLLMPWYFVSARRGQSGISGSPLVEFPRVRGR